VFIKERGWTTRVLMMTNYRRLFVWVAAGAFLVSAPAVAKDKAPKDVKPKEVRICKSVQKTGTRFGSGRICKTAAEWNGEGQNDNGPGVRSSDAEKGATGRP
jgi:hypothetical protein